VDRDGEERPLDDEARASLDAMFRERSEEGVRVLALASATLPAKADYTRGDEACLTFRGFLLFLDPPKSDAAETLRQLKALGIAVKVVSGDNRHITAHVARAVGLDAEALLTGEQVAALSEEALWHVLPRTDLFVEIDPQQKERIVRALGRIGHSVGYLGDGINDAPALRAADVGISVDSAVDVARESADVILLRPDLGVLRQGVIDGRRTFVNTLKYISITTSANFGNMVSMAVATPFLPFLPLLPKKILLNNILSDLPSAAISTDTIDPETVERPQRWNVAEVRRFMLCFGLISSFFDLLTFATLLFFLGGGAELFRTFWFLVSLLTELGVVLVLRTRRPFLRSTPGRLLLWGTLGCAAATLTVPFLGGAADLFGFVPLRPLHLLAVLAIVASYLAATEMAKRLFNHRAD
jgi:Mg2+-importing ATPase